jgi:hypothetical protein
MILTCVSTVLTDNAGFLGGTTEHVSRVYAAGMRHPSLHGWIYGVSDNVLCGDAFPPNPILTWASTELTDNAG